MPLAAAGPPDTGWSTMPRQAGGWLPAQQTARARAWPEGGRLPPEVAEVISQPLSAEPADRPPSARAVRGVLFGDDVASSHALLEAVASEARLSRNPTHEALAAVHLRSIAERRGEASAPVAEFVEAQRARYRAARWSVSASSSQPSSHRIRVMVPRPLPEAGWPAMRPDQTKRKV